MSENANAVDARSESATDNVTRPDHSDKESSRPSGARLNVNINARTAEELRRVARRDGITYTEAVRRAVELLAFVVDERDAGHAIQVYDPGKDKTRELITL